jgi:hypothetical protein
MQCHLPGYARSAASAWLSKAALTVQRGDVLQE